MSNRSRDNLRVFGACLFCFDWGNEEKVFQQFNFGNFLELFRKKGFVHRSHNLRQLDTSQASSVGVCNFGVIEFQRANFANIFLLLLRKPAVS